MKTLQEVVDYLWKPKLSYCYYDAAICSSVYKGSHYKGSHYKDVRREALMHSIKHYNVNTISKGVIENKYIVSRDIMKPFYGREISEPCIIICKRMVENSERFVRIGGLVKDLDTQEEFVLSRGNMFYLGDVVPKIPVKCTDNISFMNNDELTLLTECLWICRKNITDVENKEKQKKFNETCLQEKQRMLDLYKGL